jgi:hypothetical protein
MATTTRFSVAKTEKSYSPLGVAAVLGSTVKSETEQWTGGLAYPAFQIYYSTSTD